MGSVLTVAYGLRLWWGAFATKQALVACRGHGERPGASLGTAGREDAAPAPISRPSLLLVWPAMVLGVLGLAVALLPQLGEHLLAARTRTPTPRARRGTSSCGAGSRPRSCLTLAILLSGALLFVVRDRGRAAAVAAATTGPEADHLYRRFMRRLDDVAADVTAVTQRGSLPFYLGLILIVFVLAVGVAR